MMSSAVGVVDRWSPRLAGRDSAGRLAHAAIAAAGVAACAVAAAVTLSGLTAEYAVLQATARAAIVGVPIAVGLYALHGASSRFGQLLILTGFIVCLGTLSESPDPWLYSIGRVVGWTIEVALVYLILSFPTGRLPARVDRVLVGLIGAVVLCLYLPTALLVEDYPVPSTVTACGESCPPNAFMVVANEPAVVEDLMRPLRELLTIALFVCVTIRVGLRIRSASPLAKRALGPVLAVSIFRLVVFLTALVARRLAPESAVPEVASWLLGLAIPLLAVAFLVGVWRWRLFIAEAMQRLAMRLQGRFRPPELRRALAEEFDDPTLEFVHRAGDHWVDAAGEEIPAPEATAEQALSDILDGGERVAAILHDPALSEDAAFTATATAYALMTLESERLAAQTDRLLSEVREARMRARSAAEEERRRIEHDLHDGAQQRLIALGIKLELAAERTAALDPGAAKLMRGLGAEVDQALDEVRALARGDLPAELGLGDALRTAARSSALPVTVLEIAVRRYPHEIETAAFFCCLEALQNASKHARDATVVVVELADDDHALSLEVRDDGDGFDERAVGAGIGLASMRERIEAVGGEVSIRSRPGGGTRVRARIPIA